MSWSILHTVVKIILETMGKPLGKEVVEEAKQIREL